VRVKSVYLPCETRIVVGAVELAFEILEDQAGVGAQAAFGRLLGESAPMRTLVERLSRLAPRDTTLLLEGESGTGKRLAAEVVHAAGPRRARPLVVVDCRRSHSPSFEAELFGETPADGTARPGAFARANGGTLVLDEIAELELDVQRKVLGVLESREVSPLGSGSPALVDVRIIASTTRDLYREVGRGLFRDDLYYALAAASLRMPPLRERLADIPILANHFLKEHSIKDGVPYAIDCAVMERLTLRPWPGNVRELRNAVETILALGTDERSVDASARSQVPFDIPFKAAKARLLEGFERDYLVSVLGRHGGNITAAASAAGVDRVHFLRLLDRYGLRKTTHRTV
jgi:DNA-binding NtrC family response regulator